MNFLLRSVIFAPLFCLAAARVADTPAAAHTFTSADGKTMQAVVLSVANDSVSLKRADGQTVKVPLTAFGEEDQAYVRQIAVQQAVKSGKPIFRIAATVSKANQKTAPGSAANDSVSTTSWQESYKVTLANNLPLHLVAPSVQYNVIISGGTATLSRYFTDDEITDIPGNANLAFTTSPINCGTRTDSKSGKAISDTKTLGVWIRIYDSNKQLVQEWASSPDIIKNNKWATAPVPRGVRGQRGARGAAAPDSSATTTAQPSADPFSSSN